MLIWKLKKLIFTPEDGAPWMKSHAQVPTPILINDRLRLFFSSRPQPDISLTSYVDFDPLDLSRIIYVHPKPILPLGEPGTFDEHGIMPSCALNYNNAIYLYYSGWCRGNIIPYNNFTGLAISEDNGNTFKKYSPLPILDKTPSEPYSATSPLVISKKDTLHMWYSSGTHWHSIKNKLEHTYDIKHAFSQDGIHWNRLETAVIKQQNKFEALTRPAILHYDNQYHMWFSYRGSNDFREGVDSYRLGYATSTDLISWERNDNAAHFNNKNADWCRQMLAYPAILTIGGKPIMFVNGDHFGKRGFGYAELSIET